MVPVNMGIHTVARLKAIMHTGTDMDIHTVGPKVNMDMDMAIHTMSLRFPCLMVLMACKRADMAMHMHMLLPNTM